MGSILFASNLFSFTAGRWKGGFCWVAAKAAERSRERAEMTHTHTHTHSFSNLKAIEMLAIRFDFPYLFPSHKTYRSKNQIRLSFDTF
jgi:hypothetical protein